MKPILLSFKPQYLRPILYGMKRYEYRKRFCHCDTLAFLYLSSPSQRIIGVMHMKKPLLTKELLQNPQIEVSVKERLQGCMCNREEYVIPILSLTLFKKPILLQELRVQFNNFTVPQSYLCLENYPDIYRYLQNQVRYEREFYYRHDTIYQTYLGMSCKDMEDTDTFKRIDSQTASIARYLPLDAGYIHKNHGK